jgi:hypothetical protein
LCCKRGADSGEAESPCSKTWAWARPGLLQAGKHVLVSTFEIDELCVFSRKRLFSASQSDKQILQLLLCMLKSSLEIQNAKDDVRRFVLHGF